MLERGVKHTVEFGVDCVVDGVVELMVEHEEYCVVERAVEDIWLYLRYNILECNTVAAQRGSMGAIQVM